MKKIKYIKTTIIYLLIIILMVSFFSMVKTFIEHKSSLKKLNKELIITKVINDNDKLIYKPNDQSIYNYSNLSLLKVNLDDLKHINGNTLGFLNISKIKFSYPIMNTDFYKNHDFYKSHDHYGLPYIYNENKNIIDQNTIIVVNKRAFSQYNTLGKVLNKKFLQNDKNFVLNMQVNDMLSLWQIVSINKVKDFDYKTKFKEGQFKEYMNNLLFDSKHDFGTTIKDDEKILTIVLDGRESLVITSKLIKMQRV